jgi:hypothetical protein
MSKPASRSAPASSLSVLRDEVFTSESMSSTTILAARRVLPPDLMVPAQESAPRMKETGPEAVPPFFRCQPPFDGHSFRVDARCRVH